MTEAQKAYEQKLKMRELFSGRTHCMARDLSRANLRSVFSQHL